MCSWYERDYCFGCGSTGSYGGIRCQCLQSVVEPPVSHTEVDTKLKIGKRFLIHRVHDPSGVSGTGYVAEGIQFHDGQVVVSWYGQHHIFECPKDLQTWIEVHGHSGNTNVEWIDKKGTITK